MQYAFLVHSLQVNSNHMPYISTASLTASSTVHTYVYMACGAKLIDESLQKIFAITDGFGQKTSEQSS